MEWHQHSLSSHCRRRFRCCCCCPFPSIRSRARCVVGAGGSGSVGRIVAIVSGVLTSTRFVSHGGVLTAERDHKPSARVANDPLAQRQHPAISDRRGIGPLRRRQAFSRLSVLVVRMPSAREPLFASVAPSASSFHVSLAEHACGASGFHARPHRVVLSASCPGEVWEPTFVVTSTLPIAAGSPQDVLPVPRRDS